MRLYGVLFALCLGACIAHPKAQGPPSLTHEDVKTSLAAVETEAVVGYQRCGPSCRWTYDLVLAHLWRANALVDRWGTEIGQSGYFRCLMRHLEEPLAGLTGPDSKAVRLAANLGTNAPDRCSP